MTKREKLQSLDNKGFFEKIMEIAKLPKKELINWENYLNTDEREPYPWSFEAEHAICGSKNSVDLCEDKMPDAMEHLEEKVNFATVKNTVTKRNKKSKKSFKPTELKKCRKESGLIVRKARNKLKFKMEDLADEVGVSKSAIGNFETGTSKLCDENIEKICEVLGIDSDYLIDLSNKEYEIIVYDAQPGKDTGTELSIMIQRAMEYRNLTPENCCTELRVSPETVKRWMKGETIPSPDQENDVVKVFGFDMHEYQQARRKAEHGVTCERNEIVMDASDFRERIRIERDKKRWSRQVVDEKLRLAKDTTKYVETGEMAVTPSLVNKYSELFRIRVDRVKNTAC